MKREAVNPERGDGVRVTFEKHAREPALVWDEEAALRAELDERMRSYPRWLKRGRIDRNTTHAQIAAFEAAINAAAPPCRQARRLPEQDVRDLHKTQALEAEIVRLKRDGAGLVKSGALSAAVLKARCATLESILRDYAMLHVGAAATPRTREAQ